ncbi:predicted protein, partial [Nematostella vectensis]
MADARNTADNYSPILPAISKVIERIVYEQVYDFLTENQLLNRCQSGLRGFVAPPVKCAAQLEKKTKVTASSQWDANHSPERSRLDTIRQGHKIGAWSARHNNIAQWLQIDLGKATKVTAIVTQGRSDLDQWVTQYKLEYSQNRVHFHSYLSGKVFQGNHDRNSKLSHILKPAIIARYIRVRPQAWHAHISMRVGLYGCRKGFKPPPLWSCKHTLGVQSGFIKDAQMTASSIWDNNHGAANARLNRQKIGARTGAWSAKHNNRLQWLQVDLGKLSKVVKVATQGRQDLNQWVTTYKLAYSRDGVLFKYFPKVLSGNKDRNTVVTHSVGPIYARYVRFYPQTWHGHISMRVELYGCRRGFVDPLVKCAAPLKKKTKVTASSQWDANHSPERSRLDTIRQGHKIGAWSARHNNIAQWLQIDLGKATKVTAIVTQGRSDLDQWVTQYKLEYSQNRVHFHSYLSGKVFQGNHDRNSKLSHILKPAIIARYIRVRPQAWHAHISMRVGLYGCRK